jgi:uncharacterized protein
MTVIGLALGATSLLAAGDPVLRGVLVTGSEKLFSLSVPGGQPAWVEVGKTFEGWKVAEYRDDNRTLLLTRDGVKKVLPLSDSVIGESLASAGTPASLSDAEDLLTQMRFEEMMTKTIEQQKDATVKMMGKMMGDKAGTGGPEFEAFQRKMMDVMFDSMDLPGMKKEMAKIYADVFTKEELRSQADFYTTAGGKAMLDKQPVMQQKMTEVMMPRMMAAMPKVQALAMEFGKEQAAKKAAAKAAAAPAAAPAAPAAK